MARWVGTLEHLPALSGAIASARTGLPAGKWGRGRIRIKELLAKGTEVIGKEVVLKGWIRTMRSAEKVCMKRHIHTDIHTYIHTIIYT